MIKRREIIDQSVRVTVFNNMVSPYTNALYNSVAQKGITLTVISCVENEPNRKWGSIANRQYEHIILRGVHLKLSKSRYAHLNIGIAEALARSRPDILVINGFYPSMVIAACWSRIKKVPLALTIDGWRETMPKSLYHRIVRPWIVNMCQTIFVCGRKGRDYFLSCGVDGSNIFTVPLIPAWPAPPSPPVFADRKFHIAWAAHINNDVKNAEFFLEVAKRLNKILPSFKVRVVGNGDGRDKFLAQLMSSGIYFEHSLELNWQDMPSVFESSRALVFPSLWEPWGLVCNEAMQCGTPCIVSPHVGAAGDLVEDGVNGFVRPLIVDDWVKRIMALLVDEDAWQRMSRVARDDVANRTLAASRDSFTAGLLNCLDSPQLQALQVRGPFDEF